MSSDPLSIRPATDEPLRTGPQATASDDRRFVTPYYVLFGLWLIGTIHFARSSENTNSNRLFAVACVLTALMIGLRYQVGGDWEPYLNIYDSIYFQPLIPALGLSDPGYAFFNWLAARLDTGIWLPNMVCAILFMAGVGRLASRQPQPWLAMLVAVPYFVIVVAMGYTRQAAAIGIVCFAIADAGEKNIGRTIVLIGIAALFHKTAILMLPLAIGPIAVRKILTAVLSGIAFLGLFALLLRGQSDQMIMSYAQSDYNSQGAPVRIAMNVLAGGIFLLLSKRFTLNRYQNLYWRFNAFASFISIIALATLSASSGVDRLSLFLIPLQMVTLSRVPQALSGSRKLILPALFAVVGYCFTVEFVWLNFAENAGLWIPYSTTLFHGL